MLLHSLRQAAHPIKHYGVDFVIQKKKKILQGSALLKGHYRDGFTAFFVKTVTGYLHLYRKCYNFKLTISSE